METANTSSPLNSPHTNNNGVHQIQTTPISTRSGDNNNNNNNNPYPTTFVQADTSSFKQVVQMLTGSSSSTTDSSSSPKQSSHQDPPRNNFTIPPIKNSPKRQQQQNSFKLYERRNSNLKNSLIINTLLPNFGNNINNSPGRNNNKSELLLLSPSMLDFPKLTLSSSPVTPLNEDTFNNSSPSVGSSSEEERAIAEKGFYLHPSPISTPRDSEPQLLSLFPLSSPKVSGS